MANNKKEKQPINKQLWLAAAKLRKNIDAAEYKHIILGLVFLKYISVSFEKHYKKLQEETLADPEDIQQYTQNNIFFVPKPARWRKIQSKTIQTDIGKYINYAMIRIEEENTSLKNVLPKVYERENLDKATLAGLISLIDNIEMDKAKKRNGDILGGVFEYFLGEFAIAEGKKGGQFYTPLSVVVLLVKMIEPYKGRVFDPCCGSGGMFVQSEKFIKKHQGKVKDISIYGQESNLTTWRLSKMNLAIRHIDSSNVKWNNEGSFLNNVHKGLKADYIIANPPFNQSDWDAKKLQGDARWEYGKPSTNNANYGWIQHFLYHLTPNGGIAGFVMAKGALSSKTNSEDTIRKAIIKAGLVDCIVNLPAKLFLNTQIAASLWFLKRGKTYRNDEILFIDARNLGCLINRRTRKLSDEDISKISDVYHRWRNKNSDYEDITGFCKSASISEVKKNDYILSPGRYVGMAKKEDDLGFKERLTRLKAEFVEQLKEEERLNTVILEQLGKIKIL